jgi:hypothetical protein
MFFHPIDLFFKIQYEIKIKIVRPWPFNCEKSFAYWFNKSHGNIKFTYNVTNTNWVDFYSIISIVTMNYEKEKLTIK